MSPLLGAAQRPRETLKEQNGSVTTEDDRTALVDADTATHVVRATSDEANGRDPVLEITGGEGNLDDLTAPEVHLLMRSTCDCCQDFAQGWFRVDELQAAISAAVAACLTASTPATGPDS